jgi:hypothetical protein
MKRLRPRVSDLILAIIVLTPIASSAADPANPPPPISNFDVIVTGSPDVLAEFGKNFNIPGCTCKVPEEGSLNCKQPTLKQGSELAYTCQLGAVTASEAEANSFSDKFVTILAKLRQQQGHARFRVMFTTQESCTYKSCGGGPLIHWDANLPCVKLCSWR